MKHWKKALRFALCLVPVALIGGWFAAEMQLPSLFLPSRLCPSV